MSGIAGIATSDLKAQPELECLQRMCDALVHRGPDDGGIYVAPGVGLGLGWLRTGDEDGGHRPVSNEGKQIWVVFDGEIYNLAELRRELNGRNHHIRTRSVSELLAHLYEDFGPGFIRQLNGKFAIAVWDARRNSLLLARDRMGEKPLYYAADRAGLYFGSEIGAILSAAPQFNEINSVALGQYLDLGYVPEPLTMFRGIEKLPAGHLLEFGAGLRATRPYWDLPQYDMYFPESEESCLLELERRLYAATHRRMAAAGTTTGVGAFLGGGVESAIVIATMANAGVGPLKTFSVGFGSEALSEMIHARAVARTFHTDHHERILEPDVAQEVETLTSCMEEPFGDAATLGMHLAVQVAKPHAKVVFSGEGADEIFAGHERYCTFGERLAAENAVAAASTGKGDLLSRVFGRKRNSDNARTFQFAPSRPWQETYAEKLSLLAGLERAMPIFSAGFRSALRDAGYDGNVLLKYFADSPARDPVSQMLYVDAKTYLPGNVLANVDRVSMRQSLEVQLPMLDQELVEWAAALAARWKMAGGQRKYILMKVAERLGVPTQAVMGLGNAPRMKVPLQRWMRHELKELLMVLVEPQSLQRGYFEANAVRRLMDEHVRQRRELSGVLWRLLMLEMWQRNFVEEQANRARRTPVAKPRVIPPETVRTMAASAGQ